MHHSIQIVNDFIICLWNSFNELIFYYSTFLGKNQWNKIQWAFLKDTIAVESKAFHAYEFPIWNSLIRTEVSNGDVLEYQKLADKCSNFSNYWNLNYSHFIICLLWMFDSSIVNHQLYLMDIDINPQDKSWLSS